jgi:hypothetical protein
MVFPDGTDDAEWKVKVDCDRVDHVMLTLISFIASRRNSALPIIP